jgi:hypothetical protein
MATARCIFASLCVIGVSLARGRFVTGARKSGYTVVVRRKGSEWSVWNDASKHRILPMK